MTLITLICGPLTRRPIELRPDVPLRCRDCAACPACRTDDPPDVCPWSVEDESPAELIAGAVVLAVGLYGWAVGVML